MFDYSGVEGEEARWSSPSADWLNLNHDFPFEKDPWVGEVVYSAINLMDPRYELSREGPSDPSGPKRPSMELVNWRDFRRLRIIDVNVINAHLTVRTASLMLPAPASEFIRPFAAVHRLRVRQVALCLPC
jgi:hypothetical protein